jgi:hypothetical protein
MKKQITITVNNKEHSVLFIAGESLATLLRRKSMHPVPKC